MDTKKFSIMGVSMTTKKKPHVQPDDDGHVPRERVRVDSLTPHPLNYKGHPDDQIEHIVASIRENGVYRNVVVARDGMILAGHGVCLALKKMGREWVDVVRLDVGPMDARALKVLAGDNEIGHLGEVDDRALSELLKTIQTEDVSGLLGTGYDDSMLANLVFVTRPASEIRDFDAAREWTGAGMPEYDEGGEPHRVIISFKSDKDRDLFLSSIGASHIPKKTGRTWSIQWPLTDGNNDWTSIRVGSS